MRNTRYGIVANKTSTSKEWPSWCIKIRKTPLSAGNPFPAESSPFVCPACRETTIVQVYAKTSNGTEEKSDGFTMNLKQF